SMVRAQRAGLMLGGWILMTPPWITQDVSKPVVKNGIPKYVDCEAPLARWKQESAHDTAKECEDAKQRDMQEAVAHLKERFDAVAAQLGSVEAATKSTDSLLGGARGLQAGLSCARCIPAEHLYPAKEPQPKQAK